VLKLGGTFVPIFSPFGAMKGLHGYLSEEEVQNVFLIFNTNFSHRFKHVENFKNFGIEHLFL
jgi:hypothetical protein